MRVSPLPLSLLLLLSLNTVAEVQTPLVHSGEVHSSRRTLTDALSDDSNYSLLLQLLQRVRLIPTLNRLNGSVLFAPTNDAIQRYRSKNYLWGNVLQMLHQEPYDVWEETDIETRDNVHEQLRQDLLFHLINDTSTLPENGEVNVLNTLHYPRKPLDPPTQEPPSSPWFPIPGGALGGDAQRLRVTGNDKEKKVGVDYKGRGGSKVVKSEDGGNGLLVGIDEVLPVPQDLATIVSGHPKLTYLKKILPSKVLEDIKNGSSLSLFLPVDSSWEALPEIEKTYLESEFAGDDLQSIFSMHTVYKNEVKWTDRLRNASGSNIETLYGSKLDISVNGEEFKVGSAKIVEPDIYASNGVLHLVDDLLIPEGALKLTPEKYLLTLNCSKFISLIHSVNATYLINGTASNEKRTILAMTDDVLSQSSPDDLPELGSKELKKLVEYHFLPDIWDPKKLKDGMLLQTELMEVGLNGSRQVLPVEIETPKIMKGSVLDVIRFGGARTLRKIEIGKSIVYLISRPITPPTDALTTALPSLHLSTFIAAVFSTSLDQKLKTSPGTTILIPQNSAFENLGGLVSTHLLSSSTTAKKDLESVILHHVIKGVNYWRELSLGSQSSFGTLEGSDVHIDRETGGASVLVSASGGWTGMKAELGNSGVSDNILTQTGVMHELSGVLIPRSVELTNQKLVKAAKGTTMGDLVTRAGMGWILNGTAPPPGSRWADTDFESIGWTLLVPYDDAFNGVNITRIWEEKEYLEAFVLQHIIPTPRPAVTKEILSTAVSHQPLPLNKSVSYSTLQSNVSLYGDLSFVPDDDGNVLVRIKDLPESKKKTESAKVLSWGRCTTNGGTGGVIQIDRLLQPWQPNFWGAYGPPTAVGIIGIALIGLFFYVVRLIWRRDTMEPTYEPIGGFDPEEEVTR